MTAVLLGYKWVNISALLLACIQNQMGLNWLKYFTPEYRSRCTLRDVIDARG